MQLFNEQIIHALCWTLIHSLWQGLLLAILGALVILITKKSGSGFRYSLLLGLFCLFVAIAAITFARQYATVTVPEVVPVASVTEQVANSNGRSFYPGETTLREKAPATFISYCNDHASLIVTFWMLLLVLQSARLLLYAGNAQRLRHYRVHPAPAYWQDRVNEFARKLRIHRTVLLLESEIVKVPLMLGELKPVILFPFSLLAQLPPAQVEAALLHELAHVRRRDYLVNMLQHFTEIIFFFNPGLLWISSRIRDERENCCDDLAIGETRLKKEFVEALVAFREYHLSGTLYAMAFPGRKDQLLNRARRILTNHNKTLNKMEKISLASGIVVMGLLAFAFKQNGQQFPKPSSPNMMVADTTLPRKISVDSGTSTAQYSVDGKQYKLVQSGNVVRELYVDGKRVPDDQISHYQEVIEKIRKQIEESRAKMQADMQVMELDKKRQEVEMDKMKIAMENEAKAEKTLKESEEARAYLQQQDLNRSMELFNMQKEAMVLDQAGKESEEEFRRQRAAMDEELSKFQKQQAELLEQAERMKDNKNGPGMAELQASEQYLKKAEQELQSRHEIFDKMLMDYELKQKMISAAYPPISPVAPVPPIAGSDLIAGLVNDLLAEKVITNPDDVSIVLNQQMLKVNGVIQTAKLHAELKKKYIPGARDNRIIYSKHGNSTSTNVTISKK